MKREVGGNPGESVAQARVPDIKKAPESRISLLLPKADQSKSLGGCFDAGGVSVG